MKKRVLVAGFHHESNSFNPIITDEKDFSVLRGNQLFTQVQPHSSMAGIIDTLLKAQCTVVPVLLARAVPNGIISQSFYNGIKQEILSLAEAAELQDPIDGITLALHGSMAVEGVDDPEGDLLEALRRIFPAIPLCVALDMHTTYTQKMHKHSDACIGYKCAPHTDCYETGVHATEITLGMMRNEIAPTSSWVKIPFLVAGEKSETSTEPMKTLIHEIRHIEQEPEVLGVSYFMGFPWADGPHSGVSVLVITDNNKDLANFGAERWARVFWEFRNDFMFHTETYEPQEAVDVVLAAVKRGESTPIYLSDSGDNPTAGSSGDCTELLEILLSQPNLDQRVSHPILYGGIYDPLAVTECLNHVGEEIELTFGASFDKVTSKPLTKKGRVTSGVHNYGPYGAEMVLFSTGHVDIVIVSEHIGFTEPELFEALGVNPRNVEVVVCKLGYLTAPHRELAKRSIMALTKGSSNEVLESLPYKRIPRPMFPLDRDFEPEFTVFS